MSGNRYDANDPHSQLWIHLTAWHSILYAYEKYGPGRLTPRRRSRYWDECAVAAELQTCDPADVPRTRDGIRAYFEQMRPTLAGSPTPAQSMEHLLNAADRCRLPRALASGDVGRSTEWFCAGSRSRPCRAGCARWATFGSGVSPMRWSCRSCGWSSLGIHLSPAKIRLANLRLLSPATVPIVAPVFLGIPPQRPEVLTPAQARERYGYDEPAKAHLEWRARQHQRVFADGRTPSDKGLIESEPILGSIA